MHTELNRRTWIARSLACGLAGWAAALCPASATWAQEPAVADAADNASLLQIESAFDLLAVDIKKHVLHGEGQNSVVLGPFEGLAINADGEETPNTVAAAEIGRLLDSRLSTGDDALTIVAENAHRVQGKYRGMTDPISGSYCLAIDMRITAPDGLSSVDLTKYIITDEATGAKFMGASGVLPTADPAAKNAEDLQAIRGKIAQQFVAEPTAALSGTVIRPAPDSPYGIEIVALGTAGGYLPLPVGAEDGVAQVDLGQGQIYAVRLINDSPEPCGVALSIDGINVLSFSRNGGYRALGKFFVRPQAVGLVAGWHDQGTTVHQFQVMEYGDTPAAELGITGGVGAITAVFCAASTQGNPDPPLLRQVQRGDLATGLGPLADQQLKDVRATFGAPRASVTVRYTRPNLAGLPPEE
jgi:hypothetical protein